MGAVAAAALDEEKNGKKNILIDHFLVGSSRFVLSWRSEQHRRRLATTRSRRLYGTHSDWSLVSFASCSLWGHLSFAHARSHRLIKPSIAQLPCCVVMSLACAAAGEQTENALSLYSYLSISLRRVVVVCTTNHLNCCKGSNSCAGRCQLLT